MTTRAQALAIPCPLCEAKAGDPCRNKAMDKIPGIHPWRWRAARGEDFSWLP